MEFLLNTQKLNSSDIEGLISYIQTLNNLEFSQEKNQILLKGNRPEDFILVGNYLGINGMNDPILEIK